MLIEWGWLGSVLWAVIFFGGMAVGVRAVRRMEETRVNDRRRMFLPLCLVALAGVAIHALVDFPLQIYSIQIDVATYLGICWGSARWDFTPKRKGNESQVSGRPSGHLKVRCSHG